jgi:hypothetical protein
MKPRLVYDRHRDWAARVVRIDHRCDEEGPYEVAVLVRIGTPSPGRHTPGIEVGDQYETDPMFLVTLSDDP